MQSARRHCTQVPVLAVAITITTFTIPLQAQPIVRFEGHCPRPVTQTVTRYLFEDLEKALNRILHKLQEARGLDESRHDARVVLVVSDSTQSVLHDLRNRRELTVSCDPQQQQEQNDVMFLDREAPVELMERAAVSAYVNLTGEPDLDAVVFEGDQVRPRQTIPYEGISQLIASGNLGTISLLRIPPRLLDPLPVPDEDPQWFWVENMALSIQNIEVPPHPLHNNIGALNADGNGLWGSITMVNENGDVAFLDATFHHTAGHNGIHTEEQFLGNWANWCPPGDNQHVILEIAQTFTPCNGCRGLVTEYLQNLPGRCGRENFTRIARMSSYRTWRAPPPGLIAPHMMQHQIRRLRIFNNTVLEPQRNIITLLHRAPREF